MDRTQDQNSERERTARVAGTRPASPGERPSSWPRREPSPRPAPPSTPDSVEAYYRGPTLRHAPTFY